MLFLVNIKLFVLQRSKVLNMMKFSEESFKVRMYSILYIKKRTTIIQVILSITSRCHDEVTLYLTSLTEKLFKGRSSNIKANSLILIIIYLKTDLFQNSFKF